MNAYQFVQTMRGVFCPFLNDLGFIMDEPVVSGRHYRTTFTSEKHSILVSYEPGDEALFVIVFGRKGGVLSNIDDRSQTRRLQDLNRRYMHNVTQEERTANQIYFESIGKRIDEDTSALFKAAKELRLVLPKYLGSSSSGGSK